MGEEEGVAADFIVKFNFQNTSIRRFRPLNSFCLNQTLIEIKIHFETIDVMIINISTCIPVKVSLSQHRLHVSVEEAEEYKGSKEGERNEE